MKMKHFEVGTIKLEIHASQKAAGEAAARSAAQALKRLDQTRGEIGVIFATGASQLETLHALTSMPDLPWKKVHGFHLDALTAAGGTAIGVELPAGLNVSACPGLTAGGAGSSLVVPAKICGSVKVPL
jgi:hypothetical protein